MSGPITPIFRPHETFIGVVVPFDMTLDHELWRWAPEGVSLLFTRTPYAAMPVSVEMAELVGDQRVVEQCTRDLSSVGPSVYVYACTSGSFVNGLDAQYALVEAMRAAGGADCVTTSGALVQALAHLGVGRVATATPYEPHVTARLTSFLREAGVDVVNTAHLGLTAEIWKVPYEVTAGLVRHADTPDAEAIVVSCTNLATYDLIAPLEDELGKPIISANQATMWAALRAIGLAGVGVGQRLVGCEGLGSQVVA